MAYRTHSRAGAAAHVNVGTPPFNIIAALGRNLGRFLHCHTFCGVNSGAIASIVSAKEKCSGSGAAAVRGGR